MPERYQFPTFDSRTENWFKYLNRIPVDMDCEEQFKNDIIKIINKIHEDLVGDNKLFINYLPDTEF